MIVIIQPVNVHILNKYKNSKIICAFNYGNSNNKWTLINIKDNQFRNYRQYFARFIHRHSLMCFRYSNFISDSIILQHMMMLYSLDKFHNKPRFLIFKINNNIS